MSLHKSFCKSSRKIWQKTLSENFFVIVTKTISLKTPENGI
jgi:hypothetical protein